MPDLNFEDLRTAYNRWCEFYGPNHGGSPDRGFRAFLDDDLNIYNTNKSLSISHTTETRLAMLLSPHWFALLKAYDAKLKQYGEKVSDEAE
jgi:hypothetical protein